MRSLLLTLLYAGSVGCTCSNTFTVGGTDAGSDAGAMGGGSASGGGAGTTGGGSGTTGGGVAPAGLKISPSTPQTITGNLSKGNSVTAKSAGVGTTGAYCAAVTNSGSGTTWHYSSASGLATGDCP